MSHSTRLAFLLLFFLSTVASHDHHANEHSCVHDQLEFKPVVAPVLEDEDLEGRILQTYQNIRILLDFSTLTGVTTAFRTYVTNDLLPPAMNYLQSVLKVKPVSGKLHTYGQTTICDNAVTVNSTYSTANGVNADLVIFVTQTNEPSSSFIAYAGACLLDGITYRPIFGRLNFNLAKISATTNDAKMESDTGVVMHEITHVLAFSNGLYQYYINPATNVQLTGHVLTRTINGNSITVLNIEPLTTKLRNYFGCSSLEGAYLENQGDSGSAGSHFERRVIFNDYMTASAIKDLRVTQFSLALLEGSGWYQVDYSLAEPITYGQGKGCAFLNTPCINPSTYDANFEEFCSPLLKESCSWTQRGSGVCGAYSISTSSSVPSAMNYWGNNTVVNDGFADNCPTYQIYSNMDCEDSTLQSGSTLPNAEYYGYGGKCFMATIWPGGYYPEPFGYCFKKTCELQSGGSYILKVHVGSTTVSCTSSGGITVPGYGGLLYCPDPDKFCKQVETEGFCKRGCSGRGTCVNKVCQCADGWTFHDCSKRTYVDNCARCANNADTKRTSCYGDVCECNPSNTTCMCQLGLLTGLICNLSPKASITFTQNGLQINANGGGSTDPDGNVVTYAWNFGESSSASNTAGGTTATHTYAASGTYTVTLTVTDNQGATGSTTKTVTVTAGNTSPTAAFTVSKTYLQVSVNGGTSSDPDGNIVSYSWNFGESSSSSNTATGTSATHTYAAGGSYTVTLIVTDNQGAIGTTTQTVTVVPNVSPTAAFTVTKSYLQASVNGATSSDSDGSIVSYAWNFGESSSGASNTATGATATHTYATGGSYTVTLTVTDNQGATGTVTQTVTVVPNVSPTAAFTTTKSYLQVNVNGGTSSDSDGTITSYAWNFGEPSSGVSNTATGATATHSYAAGGSYTVTLTVTDNQGATGTITQTVTVAANVNPIAALAVTKSYLQVSVNGGASTDSDGTIVSYAWNFGEASSGASNTATGATATHTYAAGGSYTVTLTVTDNQGATGTSTQTVTVAPNVNPTAAFTATKTYLQINVNGGTSTDSDGTIVSYAWNFGEASSGASNTATGATATHTYAAAGTYTVTLTVTDNQGATGTTTQTVTVVPPNVSPTAAFAVTKSYLQVSVNGGASTDSDGTIASYAWNFGEASSGASNTATGATATHTYAAGGSYTVTLTVTDNQGATGITTQTVTVVPNVGPTASFTVTKTNLQISVNGGASTDSDGTIASYAWNFGETSSGASNTATGLTATHTYAAGGTYTVTLTVTDNQGATGTTTQSVTVIKPNVSPTASFTVTKTNLQISVNGGASTDSDGTIASYTWNFGESSSGASNTATGLTATHTYAAGGTFTVTLTVTDNQGATGTITQTVTVVPNAIPTAAFTVTKTNLLISVNGGASTDSDGTIASYAWNFGESSSASNTATGATASHTYAAGGSYTVTLTVTDNQGATGTTTQTVTVVPNAIPTAAFTVTKTNLLINVNGGASTDSDGTIASYAWNFGETSSGASNTATGVSATHTYAAGGTFTVTLTVTDNQGATGTTTQTVTVVKPNVSPTASFTVTKTNLQISANGAASTDSDGTIASYAWNFGESSSASNTASGVTATHTYAAAGSYTVALTVTDNQGATGTITQTVTVAPPNVSPTAAFTVSKTNLQVNVNGGTSTDSDGTIASYAWNFGETSSGASNTATGVGATHTYAAGGTFTITLTVTDNQGATGTTTQSVTVIKPNVNPTASFTVTKTNLQISVNGGASTDSDGTIASYAWNFGHPSSGASNTATGVSATHTYSAAGSYTVTLTVTDNQGATGTATQTVTVSLPNVSPTSAFTVTKTNLQANFNGGVSSDSDGSIASYAWNFGEPSSGASNTASGTAATHIYAAAGSYTVTLTVTDNQGATGTSSQVVVVVAPNVSPVAAFTTTRNFLQINFNGGSSIDSDGSIVSYAWNFGEPSSGSSNTATGSTSTHTYAAAGSYTVTLTVTDNKGATGTFSQTLTVSPTNISPSAAFVANKNSLQSSFTGTSSNDPDGTIVSHSWDFGDPTSGASNIATGSTVTHTYTTAGSYIVTLTVTDNLGATTTTTQTISVTLPPPTPTTTGSANGFTPGSNGGAPAVQFSNESKPLSTGALVGITGGVLLVGVGGLVLGIKYGVALLAKAKASKAVTIVKVRPTNAINTTTANNANMTNDASNFSLHRSNVEFNNMTLGNEAAITLS